ncbi:DUF1049 domain-containing protein [Candidatus Fermentibacteria bacterium]|nr:DUF1049 domain-containing protein [Candidatus Fermentibacteria bacterium]
MRAKLILSMILAVIVLIVLLQNTEQVATSILFFKLELPRAILLLVTLLVGFVVGMATGMLSQHRKQRKGKPAPKKQSPS